MRTIPLNQSDQRTLNASGGGSIELGPVNYGVSWTVTTIAVAVEPRPTTLEPECAIYLNGKFIGGTYSGSLDSSDGKWELQAGDKMRAVWTGGDVGKTAILTLLGSQTIVGG